MINKNNGGPAFPIPGLSHDADFNGLSIRDYFAAKAMQGLVIRNGRDLSLPKLAEFSYEMADAMLKERDK